MEATTSRTQGADNRPVVHRGVPEGGEERVAALYWEAFGRKLAPALNPPRTGRAFIAAHLHRDRGVVALAAGRVVGVAGYRLEGRALTGGGIRDVLSAYGFFRGLPRLALLVLFERTPAAGELVMDGIAVDAAHRGQGIGSLLLREITAVAADHGCRRIRLDVIDTNPRARALYERHGFTAHRTEQTPYLRSLMGFGAVTTMHRPVTDADATSERKAR
ncbi:GNAT family N-acetyltransferase [Streptomyces paradoxus]|uniref:GNAT family N-acetyltransferase n=1 Tax=Streptomyces paradoxus TaxID=66375 RepID=UPI00381D2054